ncbi:unnamed protein product [Adineta steineri]|uniref:WAP domain-containing protein n=1 Tax=Adineta steineri TaxID=433720 RepID=A0A813PGX0_9BILA|nr:unnamed protein product [Adineta steineri]
MACDFKGNDLCNVRSYRNHCRQKCAQTNGCTHFAWSKLNNGTCWMKSGPVSKNDASSTSDRNMICGILSESTNQKSSEMEVISGANTGQKVCPGYGFIERPQKCESSCSAEKDECPSGEKCCFRIEQPCGFHCVVPKDNKAKPGNCPTNANMTDNLYWKMCDEHSCDVDNDCHGTNKCCRNQCHSTICIDPQ